MTSSSEERSIDDVLSPSIQQMFQVDGENLPLESTDIADLDDFLSKNDELALDIHQLPRLETSSSSSAATHNICDVILQLHGDHQQLQDHLHEQQEQVTANNRVSTIYQPINTRFTKQQPGQNIAFSKSCSASGLSSQQHQKQQRQQFHPGSMPESPPDSSSEPYSPPQHSTAASARAGDHRYRAPNHQHAASQQQQQQQQQQYQQHKLPIKQSPDRQRRPDAIFYPSNSSSSASYATNGVASSSPDAGGYPSPVRAGDGSNHHHHHHQQQRRVAVGMESGGVHLHHPVRSDVIEYNNQLGTSETNFCFANVYNDATMNGGGMYAETGLKTPINSKKEMSPARSNSSDAGSVHGDVTVFARSHHPNGPVTKKRKVSDQTEEKSPEQTQISASLLNQQYRQMMNQQLPIKQEPGILRSPSSAGSSKHGGYFNDGFEMTETSGGLRVMTSKDACQQQEPITPGDQTPPNGSVHCDAPSAPYQVIKWSPFRTDLWCDLFDTAGKELQTVSYRVDADKGFNFAITDDTFVCQKKNHFQVTVHIGVVGHPYLIRTDVGLRPIEAFYINLYGVKYESTSQTISIEQSQSDRSKKPFHPVKVDLPGDQVTKVTIGRLHFSETTTNNMRKKGRPNPDQRYFMCVVGLNAQAGGKSYVIAESSTEKIIVRASNPGQFDQDDVQWQRGPIPDAIYHHGRVGINYDHPDEALVVHGNIKLTGHLMQPSDERAKEDILEVDTSTQLRNVSNIRLCRYRYSPEYALYAGIDDNRMETGVIAQEFAKVLPEAVRETGDVRLPNGKTIDNFLVIDKERLFMENVGAVKELCKLTGNFSERIDELERWNKKLSRGRKYDSFRSTISGLSGFTMSSSTPTPSGSRAGSVRTDPRSRNDTRHRTTAHRRRDIPSSAVDGRGCLNNRFVQTMLVIMTVLIGLSVIAMSTLYIIELTANSPPPSAESGNDSVVSGRSNSTVIPPTSPSNSPENETLNILPVLEYCPRSNPSCDTPRENDERRFCCANGDGGSRKVGAINVACARDWNEGLSQRQLDILVPGLDATTLHPYVHAPTGDVYSVELNQPEDPQAALGRRRVGKKPRWEEEAATSGIDPDTFRRIDRKGPPRGLERFVPPMVDVESTGNDAARTVRRKSKRSAEEKVIYGTTPIVSVDSVLLVEPNVTIRTDESDPYIACAEVNMNYTYNIPLSPDIPDDISVSLQFNLKSVGRVILCKTTLMKRCPDPSLVSDEDDAVNEIVEPERDDDVMPRFDTRITSTVSADYHFRVTRSEMDARAVCDAGRDDAGRQYSQFNFHFYRVCANDVLRSAEFPNGYVQQNPGR